MDLEIKFFHETPVQDPKLLVDHIHRMASGEAPFFPATLGLVYGTLAKKVLPPSRKVSLVCSQCRRTASLGGPFQRPMLPSVPTNEPQEGSSSHGVPIVQHHAGVAQEQLLGPWLRGGIFVKCSRGCSML